MQHEGAGGLGLYWGHPDTAVSRHHHTMLNGSAHGCDSSCPEKSGTGRSHSCILLTLIFVICVLAIASIIISVIALSSLKQLPPPGGDQEPWEEDSSSPSYSYGYKDKAGCTECTCPRRPWVIAFTGSFGSHDEINDEGIPEGFGIEVLRRVCSYNRQSCRIVIAPREDCWDEEEGIPGQGLLGRWYDGCMGWWPTQPRVLRLAFTQPYTGNPDTFFWGLDTTGQVPKTGDKYNLNNLKIAYISNYGHSDCLRNSAIFDNFDDLDELISAESLEDAVALVVAQEADYLISRSVDGDELDPVERKSDAFKCAKRGAGVMTLKDSCFPKYFNLGLRAIFQNGDYGKLCEDDEDLCLENYLV